MPNTLLLKRSSTASAVPTTGQLSVGEIAINTNDGRLFARRTSDVVEIGFERVSKLGDTMTGALNINNSTASTSTTTGALIVAGGAGIGGSAFIGGTIVSGTGDGTGTVGAGNLRSPNSSGTNIAGANLNVTAGAGTGTGGGGSIIFQTATAGTTGTTQNTQSERVRITNAGNVVVGSGEATGTVSGGTIRAPNSSGTNIAGGALTITGGAGTGTGGGGSIIFQTAPAGSTGTTQNTQTTVLTIDNAGNLLMGATSIGVVGTATTGAVKVPSGTDAERPTNGTAANLRGMIRYNTTSSTFEGHNGTTWGALGSAGATPTLQQVTTAGASSSNAISITNATASTSTTTGALTVTGGVGIGGNLYVGGTEVIGTGDGTGTVGGGTLRSPQSSGTNIAGASLTVQAGAGTGTGGGGSIIFQTAPAGTTGSTQNTQTTALTIANDGTPTFSNMPGVDQTGQMILGRSDGTLRQHIITYQNSGSAQSNWIQFAIHNGTLGSSTTTMRWRGNGVTEMLGNTVVMGNGDGAGSVSGATVRGPQPVGTNLAGVNLTIQGGGGTGTGGGGSIIFQTAPAGSSGTTTNAMTTAMTIANTGVVSLAAGVASTTTGTGSLVVTGGVGVSGQATINNVSITATTASTNSTTGALIVAGGTGVAGQLNVAGATNTFTGGTASTTTGTGTIVVTGGVGVSGQATINNASITASTASTTTTTGALIVTGGVGVGGQLNVGGATSQFTNTTASTSTTTGTLVVAGGVGVAGNLYVGGTEVIGTGDGTGTVGAGNLRSPQSTGTNIAGANLNILAGAGTGTGGGGAIIFQTAPAGSTGATQNTQAERLRVTNAGAVVVGSGEATGTVSGGTIRGPNSSGTNIAGSTLTIQSGAGTGTGGGGSIVFQTAPAGTTGTTQNTQTTAVTIANNGSVTMANDAYVTADLGVGGTILGRFDTALSQITGDSTTVFRTQATGVQATYQDARSVWQTVDGTVARYTGSTRRLLVEGARTNSVRNPRFEGGSAGSPGTLPTNFLTDSNNGLTRTVVGFGTEFGLPYMDVRWNGTTSGGFIGWSPEANNFVVAAQNQVWTGQFSARLVGGTTTNVTAMRATVMSRNSGGTVLQTYTNTAAISSTFTTATVTTASLPDATTAFVHFRIDLTTNTTAAVDITMRFYAPQLELGAFASTPILPPAGTPGTSTRGADAFSVPLSALGIGSNAACTVIWTGVVRGYDQTKNSEYFVIDDDTDTNRITTFSGLNYTTPADVNFGIISGGAFLDYAGNTFTVGTPFRIALALNGSGRLAVSVNGAAVRTTTGVPTSGWKSIRIGNSAGLGNPNFTEVAQFAVLPYVLSDAELVAQSSVVTTSGSYAETLASVTSRSGYTPNAIYITNSTSSTGTGSGALTVAGGVGVAGSAFIGGTVVTGTGDASATVGAGTLRSPNSAGTNIAGATLNIVGGAGTGTGGGGAIIFQTAPAGSSGTTANTQTERVRITNAGNVVLGSGEATGTVSGGTIRGPNSSGTNIAGSSLTIQSGAGTGTGGGGSIIFQTAPAGSTGTTQNTQTTVLTIDNAGNLLMGATSIGVVGTATTGALKAPSGTSAQRPTNATAANLRGMLRYNTDLSSWEGHNGTTWASIGGGGGITHTAAATPPGSPNVGDEWLDTDTAILYKWTSDGTSTQWVDLSNGGAQSGVGYTFQQTTDLGATTTNAVSITNSTLSTTTSTGALTVTGGVGIGGQATVNNASITATTASTTTGTGALVVAGGTGIAGQATINNASITATTASTTTGTGALVVAGGVGVAGRLNVGGTICNFTGGTASTTTGTGTIVVTGGVGVSGQVTAATGVFNAGTASTTTGTGTVIVAGGVGISGQLNVGGATNTFTGNTASTNTGTGTIVVTGGMGVSGQVSAAFFQGDGTSISNLNASNLASGTVPTARLGTGTANTFTYLRGDQTYGGPFQARRTTTVSIANTETQVISVSIPGNTLAVGSVVTIEGWGLQTNTTTASTSIHRMRIGTTTLTGVIPARADFTMGTTARTNAPFRVTCSLTILSTGATGTVLGGLVTIVNHATGIGTPANMITAAVTIDTTVTNLVELTTISGAASTTWNYLGASILVNI